MAGAIDQLHVPPGNPTSRAASWADSANSRVVPGCDVLALAITGLPAGDGGGKISAGDAVERERKIVRAKNGDRAQRRVAGTNVQPRVDRRHPPTSAAGSAGRLAQLSGRARQFDLGQPRLDRQRRLGMGHGNQRVALALDLVGICFQERGNLFDRHTSQCGRGGGRGMQRVRRRRPRR